MTRNHKLSLIIGFTLVLVVAVIIVDYLSPATTDTIADLSRASQSSGHNAQPIYPRGNGSYSSPALPTGTVNQSGSRNQPNNTPDPSRTNRDEPPTLQDIIPLRQGTHVMMTDNSVEEANAPASNRNRTTTPPPNTPTPTRDIIHIVQKDDTLYSLAQRYYGDGSLYLELIEYNLDRIADDLQLRIGDRLHIPDREVLLGRVESPRSQPTDSTATPQTTTQATQYTTYKVKSGDTLTELAQEHMGTMRRWQELYELNREVIDDPDRLITGTVIRIPKNN